jgi:hypothetical protein
MSNLITGKKIHKNGIIYSPGEKTCLCGQCSLFTSIKNCDKDDYILHYQSCCLGFCPSQPICFKKNSNDCFIGKNSLQQDPFVKSKLKEKNNFFYIHCKYDPDKISTLEQIKKFSNKFPKQKDELNFLISKFCLFSENDTNNLKSLNEKGKFCRYWFSNQSNKFQNFLMREYCLRNNNKICQCINRDKNPEYHKLKKFHPYDDRCWFKPCSNNSEFFVPHSSQKKCPKKICQITYDILNANDVKIDKNILSCNFSELESLDKSNNSNSNSKPEELENSNSKFKEFINIKNNLNGKFISIILIVIFLFLFLITLFKFKNK